MCRNRLGDRDGHREHGAAGAVGVERDAVIEHSRETFDDGQSEPEAARDARALFEAVKLLEDLAALDRRHADAGIVNDDLQRLSAASAADQHTALQGIFDRVGDQVLQQPPQHQTIGFHRQRTRYEGQFDSLGACDRRELDFERTHQVADLEAADRRRHGAGVEPGNIQQRAEDFLDGFQRVVNILHQPRVFAGALAFDQTCHVKARGIERLQNVVAGRGEKPRLRQVGIFGDALGAREFGVEPRQFLGTRAHPALERGVGALQRLCGLETRCDIGEGDHQPAVRHPVGADFDDDLPARHSLEIRCAFGRPGCEADLGEGLAVGYCGAGRCEKIQNLTQRDADLHDVRRQAENFAELMIGADQLQLRIEDGDALPHMIKGGLEDFPIEMKRGMGIVEQFQRGFGRQCALPQQQRQHKPR